MSELGLKENLVNSSRISRKARQNAPPQKKTGLVSSTSGANYSERAPCANQLQQTPVCGSPRNPCLHMCEVKLFPYLRRPKPWASSAKRWTETTKYIDVPQPHNLTTKQTLVALYRAMRLRFGYGFELCNANSPRNVKNTNAANTGPFSSPTFALLVVRNWP